MITRRAHCFHDYKYMTTILRNIKPLYIESELIRLFQKVLLIYDSYTVKKEKKRNKKKFICFFSYCHCKKIHTNLLLGFLGQLSTTAKLHIIQKNFNLTHASTDKSKFETHLGYIVIIEKHLVILLNFLSRPLQQKLINSPLSSLILLRDVKYSYIECRKQTWKLKQHYFLNLRCLYCQGQFHCSELATGQVLTPEQQ